MIFACEDCEFVGHALPMRNHVQTHGHSARGFDPDQVRVTRSDAGREPMTDGGQVVGSDDGEDRLRYLTVGEIREEIAYAVGGDPTRYGRGSERGLNKRDLKRVAVHLQPDDSDLELRACDLPTLYECICDWSGTQYHAQAGCPWKLRRENLKAIHQAIGARPPREVVTS